MSTNARGVPPVAARPPVIRGLTSTVQANTSWFRIIPAWIISIGANGGIIAFFVLFGLITLGNAAPLGEEAPMMDTKVDDAADKSDLTNTDLGINPEVASNFDNNRIEEVSVPGPVNPTEAIGIPGAPPDAPVQNIPAPQGFGANGLGGGLDGDKAGHAPMFNGPGGAGGLAMLPGGFGGRSGATRERMAMAGGGNAASEAAVAAGLLFLARHQAPDGHWALDQFHLNYHEKLDPNAPNVNSNCTGQGNLKNDIAGTAFGLLPFLGAGQTHKPSQGEKKPANDYTKTVEAALKYLISKQGRDGDFGGGMYSHGLASIAVCEAYGLTSDPQLKGPAQKAINFIVYAQDPNGGGWRYAPRQSGDTSVVGWQVMALKSGQMSGLSVPTPTLKGAEKWLDSCMTSDKGGYGYTGPQETPTMSAVGLLCRMYLGWSPKNPGLLAGIARLKATPPAQGNMYYNYYATQVMHHMGGDSWELWNPQMRDLLIKTQDQGTDAKRPAQKGSWDPKPDQHGAVGGRIMITSLSLLTLEVYYRHLPLYRRDMGVIKELKEEQPENK